MVASPTSATTSTHCGACGVSCAFARATAACTDGACAIAACEQGFGNCDGMTSTGCETSTSNNPAHCGTCGTVCPSPPGATAACNNATCGFTCNTGLADCDSNTANGCEQDTVSNVNHCGGCNRRCVLPNADASCTAGACRVLRCLPGFADCDGNASNGCEVNTLTDLNHCGSCNARCASTNTTSACAAGACVVQSCAGTFRDCDGAATNGCETNSATSTAHCGACNNACPARANAATTCAGGACGFTCNAGFNDCDDNAANGCETAGACVYTACNAVPRTRPSGVYALRTGGVLWDAYCDMTSDGGGWTLVLKVDGNASTFNYDSGLWTNTTLLNPTNTNLAQTEAKFQGFVNQSFSALRLAFVDGATRGLVVTTTGTSLRDVFAGGTRATSAGRNGWRSLLASPSQQPFCNSEGFNVGVGGYRRVRLGMVTNQENECTSPDSCVGIGFGSDSNTCVTPTFAGATAGNIATCGSDSGDRNTRVFAYVFVR
jgi:hypothetical protein